MKRKRVSILVTAIIAILIAWVLSISASIAGADVTFYIERHGSPEDDGLAQFLDAAGAYAEQDFEDAALGPVGSEVPELSFDDLGLRLELIGEWGGVPYVPTLATSSEFCYPERLYSRTIWPGKSLNVTSVGEQALGGFGLWLFDDGRALDAAYLMRAVEPDGTTWEAVLENEIARDSKGHELEGFIAVISDAGLASVTIVPINPDTGEVIADLFETDHWMVAAYVPPPDPCPVCGDLDGDLDVDADDYALFLTAFGRVAGDEAYVPCADLDGDGLISLVDYQLWLGCFEEANAVSVGDDLGAWGEAIAPGERELRKLHRRLWAEARKSERHARHAERKSQRDALRAAQIARWRAMMASRRNAIQRPAVGWPTTQYGMQTQLAYPRQNRR